MEFYDGRYAHTPFGQFVARYHFSTIVKVKSGLNLDGGIPDWNIDASGMQQVKDWLLTFEQKKKPTI